MQVKYRISLDDFREAQRKMALSLKPSRSRLSAALRIISFLIVVLILGVLFTQLHILWLKIVIVASGVILPQLGRIYCSYQIDQRYKRNRWIQREFIADIHEDRIETDDGVGARSSITWDHFDRFREGKRVFVIGGPSMIFTIISKAQMSEEEQSSIRTLLAAPIPGSATIPRS